MSRYMKELFNNKDRANEREDYELQLSQAQACIQELEGLMRKAVSLSISGDGTSWFCSFCGAQGTDKLHHDYCFSKLPQVRAIMEGNCD